VGKDEDVRFLSSNVAHMHVVGGTVMCGKTADRGGSDQKDTPVQLLLANPAKLRKPVQMGRSGR
jgi:hypothetical protein